MRRTIIIAAIAALALAGCGKESKDNADQNKISENETLEFPKEIVPYLEYYSGSFHGEYSSFDYVPNRIDIYWHEDIQFTPYERPIEVSGVSDQIVYGEAAITDYLISESTQYYMDPVTCNCYYYIELDNDSEYVNHAYSSYITFHEYDTSTGLTTKAGRRCGQHEIDDVSFRMECYFWESEELSMIFTRR